MIRIGGIVKQPLVRQSLGTVLLFVSLNCGSALAAPSTLANWGVDGRAAVPVGGLVTKLAHQSDDLVIALSENARAENERIAYLIRMTPPGLLDPTFGGGGAIVLPCVIGSLSCVAKVSVDSQDRIWTASGDLDPAKPLLIRRYLPSGAADPSFGNNGLLEIAPTAYCLSSPCGVNTATSLSVTAHPTGGAMVTVGCTSGPLNDVYGTCVIGLGPTGAVQWNLTVAGFHQQSFAPIAAVYPDGGAVLGGYVYVQTEDNFQPYPALLKIRANGERDGSFGSSGLAAFPLQDFRAATQVAALAGGGAMFLLNGQFMSVSTLLRVNRSGALDKGYAVDGMSRLPVFKALDLVVLADESAILAGSYQAQTAVMRLRPDGNPETKFAGAGMAVFPFQGGSEAKSVSVREDGRIVVGGFANSGTVLLPPVKPGFPPVHYPVPAPLLFQIEGGLEATSRPWVELVSVEYYNSAYGHYFMTANGEEMQTLDLAPEPQWKRTGKSFSVWSQMAPELSPVCRFWSRASFAPKSSHFYTPYAAECGALLEPGGMWTYEGNAFSLRVPDGAPGATTCPEGSRPLYRAYNNGLSGAPNHRYTTYWGVLDQMVREGWTVEGDGVTRIFACTSSR